MTYIMIQYNIHGQKLLVFEDKVPLAIIEFSSILFFGHFKCQLFFPRTTQLNSITVITLNVTNSLVLFILCAEFNWVYCFLREIVKTRMKWLYLWANPASRTAICRATCRAMLKICLQGNPIYCSVIDFNCWQTLYKTIINGMIVGWFYYNIQVLQ